ncbi:MAG TPA: hypothetical protein VFN10_13320, partial [Thermoanaerobaculia bacterium]|nr:hypothetical protein [Thermoanaerobaculia bacterium]
MRIAIEPDLLQGESFSAHWVERLRELGHTAELVSVRDADFMERVKACDGFLWWFAPLPFPRELAKRVMAALDHGTDVVVHPDWRSCWHFDDKIAQAYLLRAADLPTPRTWIFWSYEEALAFLRDATYPLVAKLSFGFRGLNVGLVRDRAEAESLAHRVFGEGVFRLRESPLALLRSSLRPLRDVLRRRAGRAPKPLPDAQRNALLLQEFVAGNDFDTRVNVIGDRAFAWRRENAPNDFRASGANRQKLEPPLIDRAAIRLALRAARTLNMRTAAVDMLLRKDGEPLISEISFFFEPFIVRLCQGHFRLAGEELQWVDGAVEPEAAILDDFLEQVAARAKNRGGEAR